MAISAGTVSVALQAHTTQFSRGIARAAQQLQTQIPTAAARASAAMQRYAAGTNDAAKASENARGGFLGLGRAAMAVSAAYGAAAAAAQAFDLGRQTAMLQDSKTVFESMGHSIQDFRDATKGMISDQKLVQRFGLASSMGISANEFKTLAMAADAAAKKTGQSQEYMFDSIMVGTARSSRLILDNLGIMVDWDHAHQVFAKSVGKSTKALSSQEKQQAEINHVMGKADNMIQEMRSVGATASDVFDQWDAAITNISTTLGSVFLPAIRNVVPQVQFLAREMEKIFGDDKKLNQKDAAREAALGMAARADEMEAIIHANQNMQGQSDSRGNPMMVPLAYGGRTYESITDMQKSVDLIRERARTILGEGEARQELINKAKTLGESDVESESAAKRRLKLLQDMTKEMAKHKTALIQDDSIRELSEIMDSTKAEYDERVAGGMATETAMAAMIADQTAQATALARSTETLDDFENLLRNVNKVLGGMVGFGVKGATTRHVDKLEVEDATLPIEGSLPTERLIDPEATDELLKSLNPSTIGESLFGAGKGANVIGSGTSGLDEAQVVDAMLGGPGAIGAAIGAAFGMGPIGAAVGQAVGEALGFVIEAVGTAVANVAGDVVGDSRAQAAPGAFSNAAMWGAALAVTFGVLYVALAPVIATVAVFGAIVAMAAAVVAVFLAPVIIIAAAFWTLAAVLVGLPAIMMGFAGMFWELSKSTKSYERFQGALTVVIDEAIQVLEPFWTAMLPLVGLFDRMAAMLTPFMEAFLNTGVIFDALFFVIKETGLAFGRFGLLVATVYDGLVYFVAGLAYAVEFIMSGFDTSAATAAYQDVLDSIGTVDLAKLSAAIDVLAATTVEHAGEIGKAKAEIWDLRDAVVATDETLTESKLNAPSGFRVEEYRFDAQNPSGNGGGGGGGDSGAPFVGWNQIIVHGDIVIENANGAPDELLDAVSEAAERRAGQQTGNSVIDRMTGRRRPRRVGG